MIRVGIAAPTPALRAGLRAMLTTSEGSVAVVGETAAPTELATAATVTTLDLDALLLADDTLLDELADMAGGEIVPNTLAVVVLAETGRAAATLRRLPLRGWGMVPLDVAPAALQAALVAAAQGLAVLAPSLAEPLFAQPPVPSERVLTNGEAEPAEPLTARESEVLALLGQGLPNKLIARTLSISEHTVKFHVSSIYAKLGVSSRTEAVSRGARRGLVSF